MKFLILSDILELKHEVEVRFSAHLRFHDACGAQSCSLEEASPEAQEFITAYCVKKGLTPVFSEDGKSFYIKAIPHNSK